MTFDADSYLHALAAAHGVTTGPGDTDGEDLARRAVQAELADIKRRAQALHDWSAVVADHETGRERHADATRPARRYPHTPGQNRRNAARRRNAAQQRR
jgi:hypothetical protein